MTADELISLRKGFGLTQIDMANGIGLQTGAYANLEAGVSNILRLHELAIERFGLALAVAHSDPIFAPAKKTPSF